MKKILSWIKRHKIWTAVIVIVGIVGLASTASDTSQQTASTDKQDSSQSQAETKSEEAAPKEVQGTYTDYNNKEYKYFINEKDGKNVALFQPVLPRDDGTVVGAMLEVAAKTYGSETKIDPTPTPVEKDGQNLISFKGNGTTYYFLIVKEDTGEVNSLTYWKD